MLCIFVVIWLGNLFIVVDRGFRLLCLGSVLMVNWLFEVDLLKLFWWCVLSVCDCMLFCEFILFGDCC